eukprot:5184939-Pyramimonas_sp.AAC.1
MTTFGPPDTYGHAYVYDGTVCSFVASSKSGRAQQFIIRPSNSRDDEQLRLNHRISIRMCYSNVCAM